MVGYVYRIVAPGSKCVYVGQSVNPTMRFYQHKSLARLGKGDNPGLRNFLRKHDDAEMYFWPVLDMNAEEIADEKECRELGLRVLNVLATGSRPPSQKGRIPWNKGKKCGPSWNKGKKATPELREKLRAAHLGIKPSPESNAKRSATLKGRKRGPYRKTRVTANAEN